VGLSGQIKPLEAAGRNLSNRENCAINYHMRAHALLIKICSETRKIDNVMHEGRDQEVGKYLS
jgi:hypothetical protein